jgi:hypothetical protein
VDFKSKKGDVTVTTTDAAAARRHGMGVALAVVIGLSLSLAGCGGSAFSLFNTAAQDTPEDSATKVASGPETQIAKVAINAVVGPPDALGRQLHQEFTAALERQHVGVTGAKDGGAEFNLRPYILVTKEKHGTKVQYVLDVTEGSGRRVNRFAGEEIVAASGSADTWAAITPAVAEAIAAKATGAFVAWLPSAKSSGVPMAGAPGGGKTATVRPATKKGPVVATSASTQTTGSIALAAAGGLTAVVPAVVGAPGDGSASLTAAIQRELQAKGVQLLDRPSRGSYRVEGAVLLGPASEGKQAIQIEWVVRDPNGNKVGTVSQKNDIPEGSLDGPWGGVADQAAGAAVKGILKLLPNGGQR